MLNFDFADVELAVYEIGHAVQVDLWVVHGVDVLIDSGSVDFGNFDITYCVIVS